MSRVGWGWCLRRKDRIPLKFRKIPLTPFGKGELDQLISKKIFLSRTLTSYLNVGNRRDATPSRYSSGQALIKGVGLSRRIAGGD